jgi:hypothetical protein
MYNVENKHRKIYSDFGCIRTYRRYGKRLTLFVCLRAQCPTVRVGRGEPGRRLSCPV